MEGGGGWPVVVNYSILYWPRLELDNLIWYLRKLTPFARLVSWLSLRDHIGFWVLESEGKVIDWWLGLCIIFLSNHIEICHIFFQEAEDTKDTKDASKDQELRLTGRKISQYRSIQIICPTGPIDWLKRFWLDTSLLHILLLRKS